MRNLIANIELDERLGLADDLKRLALFFDEIRFHHRSILVLSNGEALDEPVSRPTKFRTNFKVAYHQPVERYNPAAAEVLSSLIDHGIAKEGSSDDRKGGSNSERQNLMQRNIINDLQDSKLMDILPSLNALNAREGEFRLERPHLLRFTGKTDGFALWNEPRALKLIRRMIQGLMDSIDSAGSPIFLDPVQRQLLEYRFLKFREGMSRLHSVAGAEILSSQKGIGQFTFDLSNNVFSSADVRSRTIEEIIMYREEMDFSRRKFISENLYELYDLADSGADAAVPVKKVNDFITRKLSSDILNCEEQALSIWEKMYGDISVSAAKVFQSSTIGAGAGGVFGSIFVGGGPLELLLVGALAGAAKETPDIIKKIADAVIQARSEKRKSIAYVANFNSPARRAVRRD